VFSGIRECSRPEFWLPSRSEMPSHMHQEFAQFSMCNAFGAVSEKNLHGAASRRRKLYQPGA
jgi:hypothetical protein